MESDYTKAIVRQYHKEVSNSTIRLNSNGIRLTSDSSIRIESDEATQPLRVFTLSNSL